MNIDKTLQGVGSLANELISINPQKAESRQTIPTTGGVYLIYNDGEVIYVGKAKKLRRRIHTDHLSSELKDTMSTFRRSINTKYGVPFGPEMRKWILDKCRFAYLEIEDEDMRSLVEALLISTLRSPALLNKF